MPQNDSSEAEIVVTAKRLNVSAPSETGSGSFSLAPWFYLRDYGPGAPDPDSFNVLEIASPETNRAIEIVARTAESLALGIETLTNVARSKLPRQERYALML